MRLSPVLAGCLLAGIVLLAGCGTRGDPADGGPAAPTTGGTAGGAPADGTELTVTVDLAGDGQQTTWTLTCDPPAGDHPDPAGACAQLAAAGAAALAPPATGIACTQLYGGPQTARVTGTLAGEPVDAELSRTDGCGIARWDQLVPVVPVPQ